MAMNLEEWDPKIVDSLNRSLRTALHKNVVEQSNCDSTTRTIDAQKKWAQSRLLKEEKDLRQQLHQLQLEQKHLCEVPSPNEPVQEEPVATETDSWILDPEEVVNPYPITSRSKHNSGNGNNHDQNAGGASSQALRSARNLSEFESCRRWVGDLEAISSIRRGLKPPCRQRIEQQQNWARSKSLKERPQSSALTRFNAVFRSKSLRNPDKVRPNPGSSETGSPRGSVPCSRSGSLKGPSNSPRRSEPLLEPILHRSLSLKTKVTPREQLLELDSNVLEGLTRMDRILDRPRLSTPNLAVCDLVPLPPIATPNTLSESQSTQAGSNASYSQESYSRIYHSRQPIKAPLGRKGSRSPSGVEEQQPE